MFPRRLGHLYADVIPQDGSPYAAAILGLEINTELVQAMESCIEKRGK